MLLVPELWIMVVCESFGLEIMFACICVADGSYNLQQVASFLRGYTNGFDKRMEKLRQNIKGTRREIGCFKQGALSSDKLVHFSLAFLCSWIFPNGGRQSKYCMHLSLVWSRFQPREGPTCKACRNSNEFKLLSELCLWHPSWGNPIAWCVYMFWCM